MNLTAETQRMRKGRKDFSESSATLRAFAVKQLT